MSVELATWRPLWEFSVILIVLGAAGCLSGRDRMSWWMSQGLIVLGVIVGFAAIEAMHPQVDLFSLGVWIPLVLALELVIVAVSHATHDRRSPDWQSGLQEGSVGMESTDDTED